MKKIAACVLILTLWFGIQAVFSSEEAQTQGTSPRPVIQKKGTIDQDLCETTPFVFQGKVSSICRQANRMGTSEIHRRGGI
jgi:hypothetical protein